jgi:hypothetical protein
MRAATLVIAGLVTGCYSSAQRPPKRPNFPELRDGAKAEIEVVHLPARFVDGRFKDRSSYLRFHYDGAKRTYGEYRAVVDPDFNRYDQLY